MPRPNNPAPGPRPGSGAGAPKAKGVPAPNRGVVPVIPLPYMKNRGRGKQPSVSAANGSSLKIQHNAELAEPATPETVSTDVSKDSKGSKEGTVVDEPAAAPAAAVESRSVNHVAETTPAANSPAIPQPTTSVQAPEPVVSQTAEEPDFDQPTASAPAKGSSAATKTTQAGPPTTAAQPPPAIPPSRYTMPPAFQPAPRPLGPLANGDSVRGPRQGVNGLGMHHPHPSNGSLQFGGFGSNSSSPAPPHSAGFGPPPGLPGHPDGRRAFHGHGHGHGHSHSHSHSHSHAHGHAHMYGHSYGHSYGHDPAAPGLGFPPMVPYITEFVPVSTANADGHGRHVPAPAGIEPFVPRGANGYGAGPSTPHSFQDSQSSNQPEEGNLFGHFHAPTNINGVAGNGDDRGQPRQRGVPGYGGPPPPPHQAMMPGHMPPPPMMQPRRDGQDDGLVGFLQTQFQDPALTDCTLELRYADDRAPPVRLSAHRLILARSGALRSLLDAASASNGDSTPSGAANRTIVLQSDDKYLRSDAFWMAVQRLYGFPLLEAPEPAAMGDEGLTMAGTADSRFDFALGYAAAGSVLGWTPVVVRGLDIASRQITLTTLEKALTFALADVPDRASADGHTQFAYGEVVQIMMDGIVSFIINNFPAFFRLDTSVVDPEGFARIPPVPTTAAPSEGRRPRPTHIKFGDINDGPAGQEGGNAAGSTDGASPLTAEQRNINATLSRVLLNLPFAYLKPVLESTGYSVPGWASSEMRHQIMVSVVSEREARRTRALDAVREGQVPRAAQIRRCLERVEPRHGDAWDVLGWQEEVVPYRGDAPSLVRNWVPLSPQGGEGRSGTAPAPAFP
ncbi:hypothetical protein SODALDRAFT_20568 [Sodiomyces alkalinus F11]|uniref:BTB domain-containing protein n=1 Tax=Sodiomyces alkalinus (strain CBS 110278 / VKM F-3762 / F11) TaxID=1314773 RepID=A0A3N2Q7A1_SODAK|nr:hypothetical protein SODALDRAFT_20568 [Sodiomyces alkalinus F11]ROT42663.1 hypothetical protein SODALDRAFT_20568 [Sodiomyces alkalinus F11]